MAHSSAGRFAVSRFVASVREDASWACTQSAYTLPVAGSPAARSQHLVGHLRWASKSSGVIFTAETYAFFCDLHRPREIFKNVAAEVTRLKLFGRFSGEGFLSLLTSAATRSGLTNHPLRVIAEHSIHSEPCHAGNVLGFVDREHEYLQSATMRVGHQFRRHTFLAGVD